MNHVQGGKYNLSMINDEDLSAAHELLLLHSESEALRTAILEDYSIRTVQVLHAVNGYTDESLCDVADDLAMDVDEVKQMYYLK